MSFLIGSLLLGAIFSVFSMYFLYASVVISWLASLLIFYESFLVGNVWIESLWCWMYMDSLTIDIAFCIDPVVSAFTLMVSSVSLLIVAYSCSYMEFDDGVSRFLVIISCFWASMLILVSASSLLLLFVGWELVGICSWLLVSHWFTRLDASRSGVQAILVNKVGDIGILLSSLCTLLLTGSTDFLLIDYTLNALDCGLPYYLSYGFSLGVISKSAQFGLHIWLPNAMEGPSPVSALIHAATMVTAGVLLLIKLSSSYTVTYSHSPIPCLPVHGWRIHGCFAPVRGA